LRCTTISQIETALGMFALRQGLANASRFAPKLLIQQALFQIIALGMMLDSK
jgi:hypothetical protein